MNWSIDDLRERVLQRDAVGIEIGVAAASLELLALRIAQVVDEHLLGEGQRAPEPLAAHGRPSRQPRIDRRQVFYLDVKKT